MATSLVVSGFLVPGANAASSAKNVIIFIGDGMGTEHVKAGGMLANGAAGTLSFESFPYQSTVSTNNSLDGVTDSGAGATAMATGVKVKNTVISLATDRKPLKTLLELHKEQGKSTGIVTTSFMEDASPAAFGAHELSRANYKNIVDDFLKDSRPNVLFGGGGFYFTPQKAGEAGYQVVTDLSTLQKLNTGKAKRVAGVFGMGEIAPRGSYKYDQTLPSLAQMTETALNVLEKDPEGLFLVVEHEGSDTHSHDNKIKGSPEAAIRSVVELSNAVKAAVDWATKHPNTIILVTADHETGGLTVDEKKPVAGQMPALTWQKSGHTAADVPVYAVGVGAKQAAKLQDNTDIFQVLKPASKGHVSPVRSETVNKVRSKTFNPTPLGKPDTARASVAEISIDVLSNDVGNGLVLVPNPEANGWSLRGGRVSISNNKLRYKAKSGYAGEDKIWYHFKDVQGRTNWGVVTIDVSQ